jgi:hypothetical protein
MRPRVTSNRTAAVVSDSGYNCSRITDGDYPLMRRGARVRSRPWSRCYSRRGTGCYSSRRSRGRCWANCCRRRWRWCRCRRLLVKVSRTLPGVAAYSGVRRANERSRAVPRQCGSEIVIHRSVAGNERVGLAPVAARFGEQIGLALIGVASDRRSVCAYEGGAAIEGDRIAEVGVRRTVARGELLSFAPTVVRLGKDVGRALQGMAVDSRIVRADESGAAVEGDRFTEAVISCAVAGGELLRLAPRAIRLGEHIERALARVRADRGAR